MFKCPVCKQYLAAITDYHCEIHGMTREEFLKKYDINSMKLTYKDMNNTFKAGKKTELDEAQKYFCSKKKY